MADTNSFSINSPDFWESIYQSNDARWDMGTPTPAFIDLYEHLKFPQGAMLVPGCGRGYDAVYFALQGFQVTAVDFADTAVRDTLDNANKANVNLAALQEDVFQLAEKYSAQFDYVLEYTCFCAIDPLRRGEYADVMRRILKPGGLFIGLFFPMDVRADRPPGPPFAVTESEITSLFSTGFQLESSEEPARSVTPRKGREKLMLWRKI